MATLKNVELFAPGRWFPSNGPKSGVEWTREFVENLFKNTKKRIDAGKLQPMLKVGHVENQFLKGSTKGDSIFGFAKNFRMKGEKIIADFINIPTLLHDAIKKKRLTNLSVEIRQKTSKDVFIDAIALLGTDNPAVKSIKDLQSFLSERKPDGNTEFVLSWDETESQWRYKAREPTDFISDTFQTKDLDGVEGVQIVTGKLKPEMIPESNDPESLVLQAYHFDKEFFDFDQAQAWITENTNFSENSAISFAFSEPFIDEQFFKTPIEDKNMGDKEKEIMGVDPQKHADVLAELSALKTAAADLIKEKNALLQFKEKTEASDEAQTQAELEKAQKEIEELKQEKTQFSEKDKEVDELKVKVQEFEDKEKAIHFSIKKDAILMPYKSDVKEGKLSPAMVTKLEKHIDSQKENFSEGKDLTVPADLALEIGKAYAGDMPSGEQGSDLPDKNGEMQFGNISDEIAFEAKKLMAKNSSLNYTQASELVLELQPTLANKYKAWVMKFSGQ